jgi:hypothetical protein
VNNGDPPVADAYQITLDPEVATALKATVPVPQRDPGVVDVMLGLFIEIATVFESANPPFAQVTRTK